MNNIKSDIHTIDDIKLLVDTFYDKVKENEHLSPIFEERIQNKWQEHLNKMYQFWQTVLLGEHTYSGSPFPPHATLPIEFKHFQSWLQLFNETITSLFEGEKADKAKWQSQRMAEMFHSKIEFYKQH